jgi:hypothetical protein
MLFDFYNFDFFKDQTLPKKFLHTSYFSNHQEFCKQIYLVFKELNYHLKHLQKHMCKDNYFSIFHNLLVCLNFSSQNSIHIFAWGVFERRRSPL